MIAASGFVGRQLVGALLAEGRVVRCLVRNPARVPELAEAGCEIVQGDISDAAAVRRAMASVAAVYVSIHTLSPQPAGGAARFTDVEKSGLQNVIAACRSCGVTRVVYVTSLGVSADASSEWLRERWHVEQSLVDGGIDATVVRPGHIVGVGGRGFDTMVGNARRRVAITFGGALPRMRTIAIDDLVCYLVGVLDDPRTYGQRYDVGDDDVLSINQLIDGIAAILGRRRPIKAAVPMRLLGALAPFVERGTKLPAGAVTGFVDGMKVDAVGDPVPIRAILPRPLLPFRAAVERALSPSKEVRPGRYSSPERPASSVPSSSRS